MIRVHSKTEIEGRIAARREIEHDGWTGATARAYLSQVGAPRGDFAAGYDAYVRAFAKAWTMIERARGSYVDAAREAEREIARFGVSTESWNLACEVAAAIEDIHTRVREVAKREAPYGI